MPRKANPMKRDFAKAPQLELLALKVKNRKNTATAMLSGNTVMVFQRGGLANGNLPFEIDASDILSWRIRHEYNPEVSKPMVSMLMSALNVSTAPLVGTDGQPSLIESVEALNRCNSQITELTKAREIIKSEIKLALE